MTFGVQIYASDGTTLVFDSTTVVGGVTAAYVTYAGGNSATTLSYPQWAGYTPFLLDCGGMGSFVTISVASGYPVLTVSANPNPMAFALFVY